MSEIWRPKIAILASGNGSTAEAFIHATQNGLVDAEVGLVICNNPPEKAGIYDRVKKINIEYGSDILVEMVNGKLYPNGYQGFGKQTAEESTYICKLFKDHQIAHVALMGYMKEALGDLVEEYGQQSKHKSIYQARMINTHPGPLPETENTYGIHTSQKVLDLGILASKHTVHLVASGYDLGEIIAEHSVEILAGDTAQDLFDRVQIIEKRELPLDINNFLQEQKLYINKN